MTNINHRLRKLSQHQEWQISKNIHLGISLCLIRFIRKDPDAGKDWRQEKKAARDNEIVGWHHQLNGHEFELQEMVKDREAWHAAVHGVTKSQTWLSDWTTTTLYIENKIDSEGKNEYSFLPDTDPFWRNKTCILEPAFCWFQVLITEPFANFMTQRIRRVMSVLDCAWALSRFRCVQLFATL